MIGQTISHYRIVEKLGGVGMGVVYKAEDTRMHRFVALKLFARGGCPQPTGTRPLSARSPSRVGAEPPPNICTIYDVGEQEGQALIAMGVS
jgi:serine/threonine protein kinase